MRAIAFANRLIRDLDVKSLNDLDSDVRLELVDAINGGLQKLHAISPQHAKVTTCGMSLAAPEAITISVTNGSTEITDCSISQDQIYRTIRIDGDSIDNQIVDSNQLLHAYGGASGVVNATIYGDAVIIPEPYAELVGWAFILETRTALTNAGLITWKCKKQVRRPDCYSVEPNSKNRNSPAPAVIRFDSLPDKAYRIEAQFTLAPARINFSDILSPASEIPLRSEYIEVYLLPIARGILTSSSLWKDHEARASARNDAEIAAAKYEALVPHYLATPRNTIRTKRGF